MLALIASASTRTAKKHNKVKKPLHHNFLILLVFLMSRTKILNKNKAKEILMISHSKDLEDEVAHK